MRLLKYKNKINAKELSIIKTNLRTEMTPAIAFCDLLLFGNYGDLNSTQVERIQRINKHLKNMANIISIKDSKSID